MTETTAEEHDPTTSSQAVDGLPPELRSRIALALDVDLVGAAGGLRLVRAGLGGARAAPSFYGRPQRVAAGAATVGSPGWIHPASPLFNDSIEIVYDPELAAQMLDDAGITDSGSLEEVGGLLKQLVIGQQKQNQILNELVQQLGARGVPSLVFTVNDTKRASYLRQQGVAGIFTDIPAKMAQIN